MTANKDGKKTESKIACNLALSLKTLLTAKSTLYIDAKFCINASIKTANIRQCKVAPQNPQTNAPYLI